MVVVDLIASIKSLTESMTQFGKDFERRSMGLGLNFEQASQRLGKGFDQLHGDMSDRMQVGLQSVAAGLQTTDGGLSQLINQQKLTGQQWQQTAAVWTNVVAAGVANEEAMKVLAENTINLGDTYTIQTSVLTGVIKSLERSMVDMGLADMGPQVLGAITELQAVMGPQQKASFEKINQMIFDTSVEGYQKLALLNIPNIREQLSAARTQGEASQLLMSAIKTAGMTIDNFTSDADQAFIRLGQASQIFGDSAKLFSPVAKALNEDARKSMEERTLFFQQWDIMFKDVITPLEFIFKSLIFSNLKNLTIAMTDFGKAFVEKIKELIKEFGGTEGLIITVEAFRKGILIAGDSVITAFDWIHQMGRYLFGEDGYIGRAWEHTADVMDKASTFVQDKWIEGGARFSLMMKELYNEWINVKIWFVAMGENLAGTASFTGKALAAIAAGKAGAAAGTAVLPGWGTAIGGVGAATAGWFGMDQFIGQGGEDSAVPGLLASQQELLPALNAQRQEVERLSGISDSSNQIMRDAWGTTTNNMPQFAFVYQEGMHDIREGLRNLVDPTSEMANQVAEINDKIPDPNDGGILAESAFILGDAIERVLGFDKGPQGIDLWEEMVELQREIAERERVLGIAQGSINAG